MNATVRSPIFSAMDLTADVITFLKGIYILVHMDNSYIDIVFGVVWLVWVTYKILSRRGIFVYFIDFHHMSEWTILTSIKMAILVRMDAKILAEYNYLILLLDILSDISINDRDQDTLILRAYDRILHDNT